MPQMRNNYLAPVLSAGALWLCAALGGFAILPAISQPAVSAEAGQTAQAVDENDATQLQVLFSIDKPNPEGGVTGPDDSEATPDIDSLSQMPDAVKGADLVELLATATHLEESPAHIAVLLYSGGQLIHALDLADCAQFEIVAHSQAEAPSAIRCDGDTYEYSMSEDGVEIGKNSEFQWLLALKAGAYILDGENHIIAPTDEKL